MSGSRYYNQLVERIEYNPRLFLILLIWACVVVFSYQFASMMISQWMMAGLAVLALVASVLIVVWPFQGVMIFLAASIWYHAFFRGGTIMGLGGALVYPGDLFIVCFLALEFFRGCTRQTRLYTTTDRWMLAFFVWQMVCMLRGIPEYKNSAYGEAREYVAIISYFVAIHYVTRPEDVNAALRWLKWILVLTAIIQLYFIVEVRGLLPRYGGGLALHLFGCLNMVVLGVLMGRDHMKRYRFLASVYLVVLLALLLYSGMRALTVSVLACLPFVAIAGRRHFFKAVSLWVIGLIAFVVFVMIMDPIFGGQLIPGLERQYRGIISPEQDPTAGWRLYGWRWEMDKIFSNPFWVLIGQGYGGYYEWFFSHFDEIIRAGPHNFYIQMWSKTGLVGLALYAGVIVSFYIQAFRFLKLSKNDFHRSVMMIIMIFMFAFQINHFTGGLAVGIWVVLAFGTAFPRIWLQEEKAAPQPVIGVSLRVRKSPLGPLSPSGSLAAGALGAVRRS